MYTINDREKNSVADTSRTSKFQIRKKEIQNHRKQTNMFFFSYGWWLFGGFCVPFGGGADVTTSSSSRKSSIIEKAKKKTKFLHIAKCLLLLDLSVVCPVNMFAWARTAKQPFSILLHFYVVWGGSCYALSLSLTSRVVPKCCRVHSRWVCWKTVNMTSWRSNEWN